MKQLFFRLNQQQYRNTKYKNKDKQGSIDPDPESGPEQHPVPEIQVTTESQGRSMRDPIDVDALPERPDHLPASQSVPSHLFASEVSC